MGILKSGCRTNPQPNLKSTVEIAFKPLFLLNQISFMDILLRPGQVEDANTCGVICYEAFKVISDEHNFPSDFPNPEVAVGLMNYLLSDRNTYSAIAEIDG